MSDADQIKPVSKYAWREMDCHGLPKRSAPQRAADFLEIYGLYDEAAAREQASRCIQCPNPSCINGCPLCNPIPQWMQLTAEGRFLEAAAVLGSATSLAEICTRLCPSDHLCEESCILNGISEPVAIGALEQFVMEYAFAKGKVDVSTAPPTGRTVAIVGSSPGALACADELAKRGHAVSIFDSALVPGGLLVNGVPAFKVEESVIQRRIDVLKQRGVKFCLGQGITPKFSVNKLKAEFDAVYLGFDSRKARDLSISGADLEGVVQAIPFLLQKNTPVHLEMPHLEVAGRRVAVVGGGDTAMDCVRAAIRCGASEVVCIYRRSQSEMPCGRHEFENAREEGAKFLFHAAPVEFLGSGKGKLAAMRLVQTQQSSGSSVPRPPVSTLPGTEFELQTDYAVLALGFEPLACPECGGFEGLARNEWGGLHVDQQQRSSMPGVFAGGDITRGPSSILLAVRDARKAAEQIDIYLARSSTGC